MAARTRITVERDTIMLVRHARAEQAWCPICANVVDVVTLADDLAREAEDFQDYVIVHELLHLRYRDHGRQFKAMMTALVPKWRELEQRSQHSTESAGQPRQEMEA